MIVPCEICGRDVNTRVPGAFERVTGFVSTNGAKGFRTDKHLGQFANESCIDNLKRGIAPTQEALSL